eukprot:3022124-Prymnesium_polylepis.1
MYVVHARRPRDQGAAPVLVEEPILAEEQVDGPVAVGVLGRVQHAAGGAIDEQHLACHAHTQTGCGEKPTGVERRNGCGEKQRVWK